MINFSVVHFATVVLIVELILVALLVIFAYILKMYFTFHQRARQKKFEKWTAFWHEAMKDPNLLTTNKLKEMQKEVLWVLAMMKQTAFTEKITQPFYHKIVQNVLLPSGRKLIRRYSYFKRYLGVQCFSYHMELQDEPVLAKLVRHPTLIVSLNAARVAFRNGSTQLLHEVIRHLAERRRFQQDVFAHVLLENRPAVFDVLHEQLAKEKTPYIRTFCYRLLLLLPSENIPISGIDADLKSSFIDLRVVVLDYLAKTKDAEKIRNAMQDTDWVIRARAASLLGSLKDEGAISLLTQGLADQEWWVRVRSAEALSHLGPKGLAILREQQPEKDKYAYEAAAEALARYEHEQKESKS